MQLHMYTCEYAYTYMHTDANSPLKLFIGELESFCGQILVETAQRTNTFRRSFEPSTKKSRGAETTEHGRLL